VKWSPRRTARYYYLRFIRLQGTPHSLALGSAIGAAIAITPTLPLHTVCIVGTTLLFRANTIAALMVGTLVSNPLTFAAQYYYSWKIGNMLLPGRISWERLQQMLAMVKEAGFVEGIKIVSSLSMEGMLVLLVGGLILAIPLGIVVYFAANHFFIRIEQKRHHKHVLN
jgi:uncharacterized protein (DUF2062 family)